MLTSRIDPIVRQGLVQWYVAGYNGALAYDIQRGSLPSAPGGTPLIVGNQVRLGISYGFITLDRPACLTATPGFTFMWRGQLLASSGNYGGKWAEDGDGVKQLLWRGGVNFIIRDTFDTAEYSATSATDCVDGREHVIVFTANSSKVQVYVDGLESGSPTVAAGPYLPASASPWTLGWVRNAQGDDTYTREWRTYNRALSPAEVRSLADPRALWTTFPSPRKRFVDVPAAVAAAAAARAIAGRQAVKRASYY
jgi:hypothetical protein